MTDRAPVSVVVLTARRAKMLARCVRSLAEGSLVPAEVVVVVNDSTEDTREALRDAADRVEIVAVEGPGGGYAEARNAGVRAASQSAIAMLDDDCRADRFWLERMAAALAEVDIVGGTALPAEPLRVPRDFHPELNWIAGLSPPSMWADDAGRRSLPTTSNIAFRRSAWEAIPFQEIGGAFAGRRHAGYAVGREDAQWWAAQRDAGARWRVETRAIVWHDIPKDRFGLETTRRRARADGLAHWKRARPMEELARAANDVVRSPFRLLRDALVDDATPAEARRLHATWAARQRALLDAAASDMDEGISPQDRAGLYVREGARAIADEVKPLVRGVAALGHHTFKSIRPLPRRPEDIGRATVFLYGDAADAMLALPTVERLRATAPQAELVLVGSPTAKRLLAATGNFDRVVELPAGLSRRHPTHAKAVFDAVRETRADAILAVYCRGPLPLGIFAATNAPVVCLDRGNGFGRAVWSDLASACVPARANQPEVVSLLNLLEPFGIAARAERPRWTPPDDAAERAREAMEKFGLRRGEFVAWATGGDDSRIGDAASRTARSLGLRGAFVGPREERGAFEALDLPENDHVSLHGMLDAAELGALLSQARAVAGFDGEATHLAQATGAATVAVLADGADDRRAPMPRLASDGDRALPFRAIRAEDDIAGAIHALLAD